MSKLTGTVKFFKGQNGYGFITPDAGGGDVFVHISDVRDGGADTLQKDDRVEFETVASKGRIKAANIKIIN